MISAYSSGKNINIENNELITVTKRTVRFSKNVYQTKNVASFSEGNVAVLSMPWMLVLGLIVFGLLLVLMDSYFKAFGMFLLFFGVCGFLANVSNTKKYGLLLSLNSGDKSLFVSSDTEGLKQVIYIIYDLIESDSEATYQVHISNSKIDGNFVQGHNSGSIYYAK